MRGIAARFDHQATAARIDVAIYMVQAAMFFLLACVTEEPGTRAITLVIGVADTIIGLYCAGRISAANREAARLRELADIRDKLR